MSDRQKGIITTVIVSMDAREYKVEHCPTKDRERVAIGDEKILSDLYVTGKTLSDIAECFERIAEQVRAIDRGAS